MIEKTPGRAINKTLKGSGHGSHAWLSQRISAVGLLILSAWLGFFLLRLVGKSHSEIQTCFKNPYQITCFSLFLFFSFYHGWLGVVEVIEDYAHCSCLKGVLKITVLLSFLFGGVLGMLSLIKLFMG